MLFLLLSLSLVVATDAFVPAGVFAPTLQGAVASLRDQFGRREPGLKTGICRGMKSSAEPAADQGLGSWVQSDGEMAAFKAVFAGEWVGYEADFRPDGSVVHVPEYMMPPELVEWDVKLKGFEHLTCSDVQGERVCLERRRLLPSCGCAVDAVPTELSSVENAVGAPGTVLFSDGAASLDHDTDNWTLILPLPAELSLNGNAPVRVQLQGRGACPQKMTLRMEERLHVGKFSVTLLSCRRCGRFRSRSVPSLLPNTSAPGGRKATWSWRDVCRESPPSLSPHPTSLASPHGVGTRRVSTRRKTVTWTVNARSLQ